MSDNVMYLKLYPLHIDLFLKCFDKSGFCSDWIRLLLIDRMMYSELSCIILTVSNWLVA